MKFLIAVQLLVVLFAVAQAIPSVGRIASFDVRKDGALPLGLSGLGGYGGLGLGLNGGLGLGLGRGLGLGLGRGLGGGLNVRPVGAALGGGYGGGY